MCGGASRGCISHTPKECNLVTTCIHAVQVYYLNTAVGLLVLVKEMLAKSATSLDTFFYESRVA